VRTHNKDLLSQERLKVILDYNPETGVFHWLVQKGNRVHPGDIAGAPHLPHRPYILIQIDRRKWKAHRLAWLYVYGELPPDVIDHINGKHDDNRICNLRAVSQSVNNANARRQKKSRSDYIGVHFYSYNGYEGWRAKFGKKQSSVYKTQEEAREFYLNELRRVNAEYAIPCNPSYGDL
jgi:hypothetical protein